MKNRQWVSVFVTSVLLGLCVPMFAHHGTNISYDRSKARTLKGTVTEFRFANPHPQLYVDVKSDDGKVTNWGCEIAANPYQLILSGWNKERSIEADRKSTRLNSSHIPLSRMPSS